MKKILQWNWNRIGLIASLFLYVIILSLYVPSYSVHKWMLSPVEFFQRIYVVALLLIIIWLLILGIIWLIERKTKTPFGILPKLSWSFIASIVVLNLLSSSLPFVIGWDSSTHYFLTIKEIIENNYFRSGIYPYLTELVLGGIGKLVGFEATPTILLMSGVLVFLYGLQRWCQSLKITKQLSSILIVTLFMIPAVQFQFLRDIKLDILLTGIILLGVTAWYEKKYIKAAIFIGISPLIKITTLWFLGCFGLFLLVLWITKKDRKKIGLTLMILVIPLLCWGSWNIVRSDTKITTKNIVSLFIKGQKRDPKLNLKLPPSEGKEIQKIKSSTPKTKRPKRTGFSEEVERYGGWSHNPFKRFYTILTSKYIVNGGTYYTNLSVLWLWFFLVGLALPFYRDFKKQSQEHLWIYGTLVIGVFVWGYVGEGVAWYGFPILIPLMIMVCANLRSKIPSKILYTILGIPLFLGITTWMNYYDLRHIAVTMQWWKNPTIETKKSIESRFFRLEMEVGEFLNTNYREGDITWWVGTMVGIYVDQYDERMVKDDQLDRWTQMVHGRTNEEILRLLKQNNIRWFLVDNSTPGLEINRNGTLHQKYNAFKTFLEENTTIALENKKMRVYKLKD